MDSEYEVEWEGLSVHDEWPDGKDGRRSSDQSDEVLGNLCRTDILSDSDPVAAVSEVGGDADEEDADDDSGRIRIPDSAASGCRHACLR